MGDTQVPAGAQASETPATQVVASEPTQVGQSVASPEPAKGPSLTDQLASEMFGDSPEDVIPSEEKEQSPEPEVKAEEKVAETEVKEEDFDPLAETTGQSEDPLSEKSTQDLRKMYDESQKQIGHLANTIGELKNLIEKKNVPEEMPPVHELLSSLTPEQIGEKYQLPDGITPAAAKWASQLVKLALDHEFKKVMPAVNEFGEFKTNNIILGELIAKHNDLPSYLPKMNAVVAKHYPQGVPAAERKAVFEKVYLGLKKFDAAKSQATSQTSQRKAQVRDAISTPNASKPTQAPKKKSFLDSINEGIDF
jgi:hypothetical protein